MEREEGMADVTSPMGMLPDGRTCRFSSEGFGGCSVNLMCLQSNLIFRRITLGQDRTTM